MPRFCDSNIETDAIIGKGIDLDDLFDKRIVVEKIKIQPTKFPGKNASGMRMQMQVIPDAKFNDEPDEEGDFFVKGENGLCIGTRRSVFTGSCRKHNLTSRTGEHHETLRRKTSSCSTRQSQKLAKCFTSHKKISYE